MARHLGGIFSGRDRARSRFGPLDAAIVLGAIGTAAAAWARARHEVARRVGPQVDVARQLRLALDAGRMGTWSWDMRTNAVDWDDALARLFGLEPGMFEKTFDAWVNVLHPDDRERALDAVSRAMTTASQFQFDHRVTWPDGSVHWIEGRGEAVVDEHGVVIGATGVAIDIDDRRRQDSDRMALLTAEREARRAAERSMQALSRLQDVTLGLSGASTVDEIADLILGRVIEALGASTGYFATLDAQGETLVLRSHVGYPSSIIDDYRFVSTSATLPAPEVLRTGVPMFVESTDDRDRRYPHLPKDPYHGAFVVCPMLVNGTPGGVIAVGFDESRPFDNDDRAFVGAIIESGAQALQRALLFEAERSSRERFRTLLEASEQLAALDDPEEQLRLMAHTAATRIGRWATVHILDGDGQLRRAAIEAAEPERRAAVAGILADSVPGGVVAQRVVGRGEPVVLPAPPGEDASFLDDPMIRKVLEDLEWTSGMAIPMVAGGRVIGMLAIGDDRPLRMGPDEVELALDLARRGASAYERARLLRASQERSESALRESQERLAAEHRLVALLQKSILPDALPRLPGVELAACYHPAESGVDVGGDWYDAFEVDDGGVVIMIGDVAGHGVEAATLMGRVRNAGRAFAVEDPDPASILTRLDHLLRVLDRHAMVTAIAAYLDPATRTLSWARAGHPPPLLCPPNGAGPSYLTNIGGTPLGTASRDYVRATETLSPDSLLVLFTDGLVERREVSIDEGLGWLASRVQRSRRGDLDALCQALIDERYRERPTEDDICVIALRVS